MFIKIQTTNSPHSGANGLIDAIYIAATAAADTTPTPYNSAWYQSWKVIDNSVAGGMTSVHQSNYRTTTTGPSIRLVADCGITSTTGEKRQFDMTFNNSAYISTLAPKWGITTTNGSSSSQLTNLTNYLNNSSGARKDSYTSGYSTDNYVYYINCQADFIWIVAQFNYGTTIANNWFSKVVGCCNLDDATGYDHSGGGHFPAAGLYHTITNSTSYAGVSYNDLKYSILNFQDSRNDKGLGDVFTTSASLYKGATTYFLQNLITYLDEYAAINDTEHLKSSWDSQGFDRPTINDIPLYHPLNGMPYRPYKGLYMLGTHRAASTDNLSRFSQKFYQVGNKKYFIFQKFSQVFALRIN